MRMLTCDTLKRVTVTSKMHSSAGKFFQAGENKLIKRPNLEPSPS